MGVDVTVQTSGPLFTSDVEAVINRWLGPVKGSYGRQGLSQMGFWMDHYFRDPTPFYETMVTTERRGDDVVIHDRGIVYGDWLAGVSSRNQTTRFKGYAHWRRTFQWLEQEEGPRIIERHLPDLRRALGAGP